MPKDYRSQKTVLRERKEYLEKKYTADEIIKLISMQIENKKQKNYTEDIFISKRVPSDNIYGVDTITVCTIPSKYSAAETVINNYFENEELSKQDFDKLFNMFLKNTSKVQYIELFKKMITEKNIDLFSDEQLIELNNVFDIHQDYKLYGTQYRLRFINIINKGTCPDLSWKNEFARWLENNHCLLEPDFSIKDVKRILKENNILFSEEDISYIFDNKFFGNIIHMLDKLDVLQEFCTNQDALSNHLSGWLQRMYTCPFVEPCSHEHLSERKFKVFDFLNKEDSAKILSLMYQDSKKTQAPPSPEQLHNRKATHRFLSQYFSFFPQRHEQVLNLLETIINDIKNTAKKKDTIEIKKDLQILCTFITLTEYFFDLDEIRNIKDKIDSMGFTDYTDNQFDYYDERVKHYFHEYNLQEIKELITQQNNNKESTIYNMKRDYFINQYENYDLPSVYEEKEKIIYNYICNSSEANIIDLFEFFVEGNLYNYEDYVCYIVTNPKTLSFLSDEHIKMIYDSIDIHTPKFNNKEFYDRVVNSQFTKEKPVMNDLDDELVLLFNSEPYIFEGDSEYHSVLEYTPLDQLFENNNIHFDNDDIDCFIDYLTNNPTDNQDNISRFYKFLEYIQSKKNIPELSTKVYNWLTQMNDDTYLDVMWNGFNDAAPFRYTSLIDEDKHQEMLEKMYLAFAHKLNDPEVKNRLVTTLEFMEEFYPEYDKHHNIIKANIDNYLIEKDEKQVYNKSKELISQLFNALTNDDTKAPQKKYPTPDDLPF